MYRTLLAYLLTWLAQWLLRSADADAPLPNPHDVLDEAIEWRREMELRRLQFADQILGVALRSRRNEVRQ